MKQSFTHFRSVWVVGRLLACYISSIFTHPPLRKCPSVGASAVLSPPQIAQLHPAVAFWNSGCFSPSRERSHKTRRAAERLTTDQKLRLAYRWLGLASETSQGFGADHTGSVRQLSVCFSVELYRFQLYLQVPLKTETLLTSLSRGKPGIFTRAETFPTRCRCDAEHRPCSVNSRTFHCFAFLHVTKERTKELKDLWRNLHHSPIIPS